MSYTRPTSIQAFNEIKPELGARQLHVFETIKKLGTPTNLELSKYLRIPINQITPRTNELMKMGYVTECEKRACSVSGRKAIAWRVA